MVPLQVLNQHHNDKNDKSRSFLAHKLESDVESGLERREIQQYRRENVTCTEIAVRQHTIVAAEAAEMEKKLRYD